MKFALCDDNPNELRQIRDYLLRYNAQANWKGFASSEELLAAFRRDYFDIVLLDIEMEGKLLRQPLERAGANPRHVARYEQIPNCHESCVGKRG